MRMIASGLQFPEGPVAMPDGSVILVEVARETLSRVHPDEHVEVIADIPGGPNGAAFGPDRRLYVCDDGGFSWITHRPYLQSEDYRGGSIDVVDLETGKVERLYSHCGDYPLKGPNDIIFDRNGEFWFTDLGKRL